MAKNIDVLDAANQKYNNATSGLTANTAQAAVDELASEKVDDALANSISYARYNNTWTNEYQNTGSKEQITLPNGNISPDISAGNAIFTDAAGLLTILGVTTVLTRTSFEWILKHNGQTIGFPVAFKFPGGTAPDLSSGNAIVMGGFTRDAGVTWVITSVVNYTL